MSINPKIIPPYFHPDASARLSSERPSVLAEAACPEVSRRVEGPQKLRSIAFLCLTLIIQSQINAFPLFSQKPQFTLMLDPAGDAHHHGRKIDDTYERSITLQCAELLKTKIQERHPQVQILLTRTTGDTVAPLQNANFANRMHVNCYISLHFYQEKKIQPQLYVYYFSYGNDFLGRTFDLMFYDYDQAHIANLSTTHQWASCLGQTLEQPLYKSIFQFNGIARLPAKSLIGIQAPAFLVEAGLKHKDEWITYIEPILACCDLIIKSQS